MTSNFRYYKLLFITVTLLLLSLDSYAQLEREQWKLQFSVGANNPIDNVDNDNYFTKSVNFVTLNLGVQHMFKPSLGAKLDLSFNRSKNDNDSDPFKLNYTRINAQLVYDAFDLIRFLPERMNVVGHIGPGISFSKPLGAFSDNKQTFLNAMAGLEFHYGISQGFSVFTDVSYIMGFGSDKFDTTIDGFAFNGDVLTVTFGISVSLSGCQYCDD